MNKYTNPEICTLPKASELREQLNASMNSSVREQIASLFDEATFVETGAFTRRGVSEFLVSEKANEFEGVITGYGAIDGKLVFAFAEDASRMGGAIDERHAKKIVDLYNLAISNGATVIGIFNSNGTDVFGGTASLASYGKIMAAVNRASGVIPQIAFVAGKCIGSCSAIASMFDFIIKCDDADFYVSSPGLTGKKDAQDDILAYKGDALSCSSYIRSLVSFLPDNSSVGTLVSESCVDNLGRMLGDVNLADDAVTAVSLIADNGIYYPVGANASLPLFTAFGEIGGVKCGIVASSYAVNEGRIDSVCARKVAKFVNFCDSFSIPVVTLVDSLGLAIDKDNENTFAPELARLAFAYAGATTPKVTVILGHAVGASFVLLGSKSLGADLVYTLDNAEIGALSAESGVAFAWDKYITEENKRENLVAEWKANVSSPAYAAASGEIDDIISVNELRARICSALLMLASKGKASAVGKRKVLPH